MPRDDIDASNGNNVESHGVNDAEAGSDELVTIVGAGPAGLMLG
jgi:hypothetical protein